MESPETHLQTLQETNLSAAESIRDNQREAQKKTYVFDKAYTFRLRRHKGGSFNGLWELTILDKKGQVSKMISDADSLVYCLENLQGEMESEGF